MRTFLARYSSIVVCSECELTLDMSMSRWSVPIFFTVGLRCEQIWADGQMRHHCLFCDFWVLCDAPYEDCPDYPVLGDGSIFPILLIVQGD